MSIFVSLRLTDSQCSVSLKVQEGNIIRHKILRMLKFHSITAFMKRIQASKILLIGFYGLNIFLQLYLKLVFYIKCYCRKTVFHLKGYTIVILLALQSSDCDVILDHKVKRHVDLVSIHAAG